MPARTHADSNLNPLMFTWQSTRIADRASAGFGKRSLRWKMLRQERTHKLVFHETGILRALISNKLIVRSLLKNPALVQDQDLGCPHYCRKPVCNDECGLSHHQAVKCLLNNVLVLAVQRARCLIQQEHLWIAEHSSSNRYTLLLAT